jgi:hypothetical protein
MQLQVEQQGWLKRKPSTRFQKFVQGYASQQLPLLVFRQARLSQAGAMVAAFQRVAVQQVAVAHRVQQQPRQSLQTRTLPTCLDSVKAKVKVHRLCEPMSWNGTSPKALAGFGGWRNLQLLEPNHIYLHGTTHLQDDR